MNVLDLKIPKLTALSAAEMVFPTALAEHTVRKFIGHGKSALHLVTSALRVKLWTKKKREQKSLRENIFSESRDLKRILDALANDPMTQITVLEHIEKREQAIENKMLSCAEIDPKQILYALANNRKTPAYMLDHISTSSLVSILVSVASNENVSKLTLQQLANHPKPEVRIAVIDNRNVPFSLLAALCEDNHADVRFAMAENSHVPEVLLKQLTIDDNPYVASRACSTLERLHKATISKSQTAPPIERPVNTISMPINI